MPNQSRDLATAASNLEKFKEKLDDICDDLIADFGRDGRAYARNITGGVDLYGIRDMPGTLTRADSSLSFLKTELDRANRLNIQLEADNRTLRNSNNSSAELRDEQRKNQQLQDEIYDLKRQLRGSGSSTTGSTMSQYDKIDQLKDEKRDLQIENAGLKREKADYKAQRDALNTQVTSLKNDKAALEKDKKDLQTKLDDIKSKDSSKSPCRRCQERVKHICPLTNAWVRPK